MLELGRERQVKGARAFSPQRTSWVNKAVCPGWASGLCKRVTTALSRDGDLGRGRRGSSSAWGQKEWTVRKGSLFPGTLQSLGRRRPLKMGPRQGLNPAVLWRPSSSISKVLATLTPPLPRPPATTPLDGATHPTRGPGAEASPSHSLPRLPPPTALRTEASAPAARAPLPASATRCVRSRRRL